MHTCLNGPKRSLLLVFLFAFCGQVSTAWSAEVALLVSSDIPAYSKAVLGIQHSLPSGAGVHEYNMKGDLLKGEELAKSIRALNPDLVFVVGLKAALVAKVEILDQPVVFCLVMNPSQFGIPTANMTGVLMDMPFSHQLDLIKTVMPGLGRLGVLYNKTHSGSFVAGARKYARQLNIALTAIHVDSDHDLPAALRQLLPEVDALWLLRDHTVVNPESLEFVMNMAIDRNLPVFGFSSGLLRYGALATFTADFTEQGRQAGRLALDILRGRYTARALPQPASPHYPQFALNLNAATFLGLTLPNHALQLASDLFGGPGAFAEVDQMEAQELTIDAFLIP